MKVRRISDIAKVFAEEGLGYLFGSAVLHEVVGENPTRATDDASSRPRTEIETAVRLRRTLERLGPTFVKFGQLLATRVDLFSDDFIRELGKLHSAVPPFPNDVAFKIIEEELQRNLSEVFTDISQEPFASASIAQVYRAHLKSTGQAVAVKIQRPNLEKNLIQDLDILVQVSGWIDALVPPYHRSMIHVVAKEYAHRSRQEIQFLSEAAAIDRFGELFGEDEYFCIPKVYRDLCTDKLIVMEWIDGVMLDKVQDTEDLTHRGFQPHAFAQNLLRLQLCMAYEYGFLHADTHPGNIILMPTGKVGIIDFGLHAQISKVLRQKVFEALVYQNQGKVDEHVEALVELSPPANPKDYEKYKSDLRKLLLTPVPTTGPVVSRQLIAGLRIGAKYRSVANPELLMIIRNLTIVEGINLKFYPAFEPEKELSQILSQILKRRFSFRSILDEVTPLLSHISLTLSQRPELIERLLKIERNFAASKNLGDFLRKEGVIQDLQPTKPSVISHFVIFVLGFLAAALALKFKS